MAPNTWAVTVLTAGLVLLLATLYVQALSVNQNRSLGVLLLISLTLIALGVLFFGVVDPEPPEII